MKYDNLLEQVALISGILIGFVAGIIFSLAAVKSSAKHSQGYGLEYANIVLNNPSTAIDTIQTIRNKDTVVTYEFKKQLKQE